MLGMRKKIIMISVMTIYFIVLIDMLYDINNDISLNCPVEYQTCFNESSSPTMEGIVSFHNHLMVVLCFISIFVGWLLLNCVKYYSEFEISTHTQFTH